MPRRTATAKALGAIAAAAAMMLAAVAPSGAANTATERLVDHDNNPRTAPAREFAGADRYVTAALLAGAAVQAGGSGDTVLVASGETQVDAVAAAGLAGAIGAPIVLTRRDTLPLVTSRFITEHSPGRVVILGGPAAVSDAVAQRIERLSVAPEVTRLAGADRYATAVAIAHEIGAPAAEWCGEFGETLLLAGGTAIADAVAAGPLAYAHAAPLLLTPADELAEATAAYIADTDIERVIIVGGTGTVSKTIEDSELFSLGVSEVRRIGGNGPAQTSIELARELTTGRCAETLDSDTSAFGLVNLRSPSDGVSAAAVFGLGFDTGRPVALLLVDATLPDTVRSFLAATPRYDTNGTPTHLELVAVGGPAAVTPEVIAAAVDAAGVAPPLTSTISQAKPGDTSFTITFSGEVDVTAATRRSLVVINGVPRGDLTLTLTRPRQVIVRITPPGELAGGDEITVVGGQRIGTAGDTRLLQGATYTVPEGRSTSSGPAPVPQVSISAVSGATRFAVLVSNSVLAAGEEISADEIDIEGPDGETITIEADLVAFHNSLLQHRYAWVGTATEPLPDGAVIRVASRAVTDQGGVYRSSRERHVVRDGAELRVDRVQVSDHVSTAQASTVVTATTTSLAAEPIIQLRALADGDAAGAAGARWRVDTWYDATDPDGHIYVAVDPRHHLVSITIGPLVAIRDLVAEINKNPDVTDRFEAWIWSSTVAAARNEVILGVGPTADGTHAIGRFGGGRSKAEMRVRFNTAVASLAQDGAELIESLFGPYRADDDTTTCSASGSRWECFAAPTGQTETPDVAMRFVPGTSFVDIWLETSDPELLPAVRDPLSVPPAVAQGWPADNTNPRYTRVWTPGNNAGDASITDNAWD